MCSNLKHVKLSHNMTYIPVGTFQRCTSLYTLVIPSSITEIDRRAFMGCNKLKSLMTSPRNKKMDYIANDAFKFCQYESFEKFQQFRQCQQY